MSRMIASAYWLLPPRTTRSGRMKFSMADPSRKNSGLETMSKAGAASFFNSAARRRAVPGGTVLLIARTLYSFITLAICRPTSKRSLRFGLPGASSSVPTAMKSTSERSTASSRLVEKLSRPARAFLRTSSASPGSRNGIVPSRRPSILFAILSTQWTLRPSSARHAAPTNPTRPAPIIVTFMVPSRCYQRDGPVDPDPCPVREARDRA